MKINYTNRTIEMNNNEAKKAAIYGSGEYENLIKAKREFPNFTIVIIAPKSKRKDELKGLTFEYMSKFIAANGSAEQQAHFEMLRTPSHDGLTEKRQSYGTIKKWFLEEFPQVLDYQKKVAQILARDVA